MKHPKSVDAYRIADTFQLLATARMGRVDMRFITTCHAGWLRWVRGLPDKQGLLDEFAELLGFKVGFGKSYRALEKWADSNPEIWGNRYGDQMFIEDRAFGGSPTLGKIARHWYGVAARLEALEQR